MQLNRSMVLVLSALTAVVAACDSQVDGDHNGTPLARLSGTVRNQRTQSTPAAEVALLWENTATAPDRIGGNVAELDDQFPAMFRISVYLPPDPTLINQVPDGGGFGVAYIFAGRSGTDYSSAQPADILGMDPDHLLIYVPSDIQAGSFIGTLLHGAPRAGFHLYNVHHLTDDERTARDECRLSLPGDPTIQVIYSACGGGVFDDLLPASADLDTPLQVELVDDLRQLDVPNWT
jgi:hypothetical protein